MIYFVRNKSLEYKERNNLNEQYAQLGMMAYVYDHTTWAVEARAKEVKPPNKYCIVHLPFTLLEAPHILLKGDVASCLIGLKNLYNFMLNTLIYNLKIR